MIPRDRNSRKSFAGAITVALLAFAACLLPAGTASAQACPANLGGPDLIQHDFSVSFCELCDVGTVRIVIENPFPETDDVEFTELVITEDLRLSGLTYVPLSTSFSGSNILVPAPVEPVLSGANDSVLTWTLPPTFTMLGHDGTAGDVATLVLEFDVRRFPILGEEGLVAANRAIQAAVAVTPNCIPNNRLSDATAPAALPLREPLPQIIKTGRNVDAGQGVGSYSDPVYAHENDDVIWRIEVQNSGLAPLQDLIFTDVMSPGNFLIDYVCDNEADATAAANGAAPGACLGVGGVTTVPNLDVRAQFGGVANPYIVAPAGGSGFYYLIGRVTSSCNDQTNTVNNVEWGCQVQAPAGGISSTSISSGSIVPSDTALLSTRSDTAILDVDVALTGTNTGQPMGSRGTVTITIRNNTGGTIKHPGPGMRLRNLLPEEYVVDSTFTPQISVAPAYGNAYPGMINTLQWTNPATDTVPLTATDPALPLSNTTPEFLLTSSTVHPDFADQFNMIRHGDVVTVTFQTVLIDPQPTVDPPFYDLEANLDVRQEAPNSDPLGTDPPQTFQIDNELDIWFEEFCNNTEIQRTYQDSATANPEDLDVDLVGAELVFILTNTGDPLPLRVRLRNRGGHEADDYVVYVTFGEAMVVSSVPSGCSLTTNPPAFPVWEIPVSHPATAAVYACDRGLMSPGETQTMNFEVMKNAAASYDDDLTFRADVIGEIRLSDDTPLWFPPPEPRGDGVTDRANNYSIDGIWARVIGYNLFKEQVGICTENNPPPASPDDEIQIGEECSFHIESGGWFGFETPGFTYIAVQNIAVVDQLPDGQGYISSTDPLLTSTPAILGVSLNPPPAPLDEGNFDWTFNTVVPGERITEKDHWFRADVDTRLLNDPLDSSAAPNLHAAQSRNVLTSTFDAVFFNQVSNAEELFSLGPNTLGFPREVWRRVDLTVTEPNLIVTKEVCNETRYGVGAACSNFVPLADDGDAFDTYVYRVTVTNEAASGGVARAPAYDVTVTSVTDPSDRLFVDPLTGDGLDNDADSLVDGGDAAGEGVITDNVLFNAIPAEVIASYTHSDDLLRIDPGQSVVLYYRVDPDDNVAPQQTLVSTAVAGYDSLEGASGAQSAPLGNNGEIGGARQYVSAPGTATIQIIPVQVPPKQVLRTSNTALVAPPNPQPVSIGEEMEFLLQALIPVAQLRNFEIRDALPPGMRCVDAPVVDLSAPPYDAAGFVPAGVFTPTCSDTEVVWSFGNQTVTQSDREDRLFEFGVTFVARLDNALANQDGTILRNGGNSTVATVAYVDEANQPVVLPIGEAALLVSEPLIQLEKTFSVVDADAADVPRVTITATNVGTASAYNLRVLDDLTAVELGYAGAVAGANPPQVDVTTFGPDAPLFTWTPAIVLAPGEAISFSFAVRVDDDVEPDEIILNTAQADWTSLPGQSTALNPTGLIGADGAVDGMRIGALPNAGDAINDYEAAVDAALPVRPPVLDKVDVNPALAPEIGVHKPFELVIELSEGVSQGLIATDSLDAGTVSYVLASNADFGISYTFSGIVSINGQPPSEAAFNAVPVDGTTGNAVWNIGTVVTEVEDDVTVQAVTPTIRIQYTGRVNNDLVTNVGSTLQNGAVLNYTNGEDGGQEALADATAAIVAIESDLTATKVLTNVTGGKLPTDPPALGDTLQYVVTVVNGGNAAAYDTNVVDTLPLELVLDTGFTPTATIGGVPVAGFVGLPSGAPAGPLVWGRQNGGDESLDLPPGAALALTYRVTVVALAAPGATIDNNVWIDWTSLQGGSVYERTGDGCPTITPPDDYCFGPAVAVGTPDPVVPPDALLKENGQATAAVGEAFVYRITIPAAPYPFDLYDVRIQDDLAASAADLRLLGITKVTGTQPWTPVNSGTPQSLVIEDTTVGIDIPANEQVVIELSMVLEDTPTNVSGLTFTNTAGWVYNRLDSNNDSQEVGAPGTTQPMTIVGPDTVTMEKTGPASLIIGAAASYTLNVHNTGTGPAWNLTILDRLPDTPTGGTCEVAPTAITAQVFEADGTTPVSAVLAAGTDYSVGWAPAPACELTLAMLTPAAVVGADQRLIVGYETRLDTDSVAGTVLTNVAGATEWFSADGSNPQTAGDRRTFTRTLTDGTVGTLDHEDAHSAAIALPQLRFEKTVLNVTTGEDPATTATPGDRLRYRLEVESLGADAVAGISVRDELDRLNDPAVFQPGTLTLVTVPAGADTTATSATGGLKGTGLVQVGNLALAGLNDTLVIEFEVDLAPVIANGTIATNQSELLTDAFVVAQSDDPNQNGQADPLVVGDEDPTRVPIASAPDFQIEKISAYVTGDPAVLLAGETLRYTITIKNVGTDDAIDATLRDDIPVNTSYLPGSTTLNGNPVPDGAGGLPPFAAGLLLQAPGDPTPGVMRADTSATPDNVATLVFDVVVDVDVIDGTIISNQAFVSAVGGGVVDQPSDDPRTAVVDDPTRDVVGNAPLLFAAKDVVIGVDNGTPGQVDPGDVLHYTITLYNNGAIPATAAVLADLVPANTTYVADSTTLNGLPVGQPDGGVAPLAGGIPVSTSDLTPPLPGAGAGVLSPGQTAVVEFDLQVNAGVPGGTVISNQAQLTTAEVLSLLTDGDGNPATGPEPTVVVVGNGQQLAITKQVAVVGGGAALAGSVVEYLVQVRNVAVVPAQAVVITDDLDLPVPGQMTYLPGSATMNGDPAGVSVVGSLITADYSALYGPLQPGATISLRFRATLDAALVIGTTVTNTATVYWDTPRQTASASVSIDIGGMPGVGAVNGALWHDANFDQVQDAGERVLAGWNVDLYRNGVPVQSIVADTGGAYRIAGLAPSVDSNDRYELRFSAPDAGPSSAALGVAVSPYSNVLQTIGQIPIAAGSNLVDLNLPIEPNGVVYEAVQRAPLAGTILTLVDAAGGSALPVSCFDDPVQQGQVTRGDGYYKFDLNFSSVACPAGATYRIQVAPPGPDYVAGYSAIIPPVSDGTGVALSVPTCPLTPDDAIPATAQRCETQLSEFLPPSSMPARSPGTRYHVHFVLDDAFVPGSSQIFNNHIPVDPVLDGAVAITKTAASLNVSKGQLVPYEITLTNEVGADLPDLTLVDRFPAGFRYIEGSARVDGARLEPVRTGRELRWENLGAPAASTQIVQLLLSVGAGVGEGAHVNRAFAISSLTGAAQSGEAQATVRVVPDPDLACTDVMGKVYDDANRNGMQDAGEKGLSGVRLATPRGLVATTDAHGRYHITCAATPSEVRGSNFALKLDDRTLPTGFRMATRPVQLQRATRGKALRLNYAASIHRVVSLDMADAVFEPGSTEMRPQWQPRLELLLDELEKAPAVLRLSYVADVEDEGLVKRRLKAVRKQLARAWKERDGSYDLEIEPTVFWRRGAPPERDAAKKAGTTSSGGPAGASSALRGGGRRW